MEEKCWVKVEELYHQETDTAEAMLQIKRGKKDRMLFGEKRKLFFLYIKPLTLGFDPAMTPVFPTQYL